MRGRWPDGPEYIDKLQGSAEAKERPEATGKTASGFILFRFWKHSGQGGQDSVHHRPRRSAAVATPNPKAAPNPPAA